MVYVKGCEEMIEVLSRSIMGETLRPVNIDVSADRFLMIGSL